MISAKNLLQLPLTKFPTVFPLFVNNSMAEKCFLKLAYIMITQTHQLSINSDIDVISNNHQFCELLGLEIGEEHNCLSCI